MKQTTVKCASETEYALTYGRYYKIIETNFIAFKITNDNGEEVWVRKDKFWGN